MFDSFKKIFITKVFTGNIYNLFFNKPRYQMRQTFSLKTTYNSSMVATVSKLQMASNVQSPFFVGTEPALKLYKFILLSSDFNWSFPQN